MNELEVTEYLVRTFADVDTVVVSHNSFFFYNPDGVLEPDRRFPFVTLMTNDDNDRASDLSRPHIFRLNIGVKPETYRGLFGPQPHFNSEAWALDTDFASLDRILPHPVYAAMSWVCVLSPSPETFAVLEPLLAEACDLAVRRSAKGKDRG